MSQAALVGLWSDSRDSDWTDPAKRRLASVTVANHSNLPIYDVTLHSAIDVRRIHQLRTLPAGHQPTSHEVALPTLVDFGLNSEIGAHVRTGLLREWPVSMPGEVVTRTGETFAFLTDHRIRFTDNANRTWVRSNEGVAETASVVYPL
ncbi:hypothetical protein AB0M47_04140 [Hamadaea sp. NPDC051192]|uniref:hypothetical protein n=1 Tax=Hamadaea sp. NPDC051192 TaxID=3154940 RepID=UPI0034420443